MKKTSFLLALTVLIICLFAEDFMQPTGPDKSLTNPPDASGYLYSSTRDAPAHEFIIDPTTIITSYFDYMPGNHCGLPLRIQPENSNPYGYSAGGAYVVFHYTETSTSERRVLYAYIDADGNLTSTNPVSTNDVRQGYPGIDIDPVTADPIIAWHAVVEPDNSFDVLSTYDLYHMMGSPGLWIGEFISIDNPEVGLPLTGFDNDEFIWPYIYVTGSSPLGGDYRRVYVSGNNFTNSHGIAGNPSENSILGYADFNTPDLDAQSVFNWTYRTMAQMDAWNAEIPEWRRPFKGCTVSDNIVAYAGYVISDWNINGNDISDAFVLINENYGEGPFQYYSSNFIFPQWNPMNETGTEYLYGGTTPYIVSQRFLHSGHMNIQFKENNTKITWSGSMGITFDALDGSGPGYYYPEYCQIYPKEIVFDLNTHEFSFKDLYIEGANPYDNIPMVPWDLDEDGLVDSFDPDGWPEWVYNWPIYYPEGGDAFHENTFKTAVNGNWIVSVWSDGTKAKRFYDGDPSFAAWEEVPEIAVIISANHGATWSEPIFLNANDTPELANQIPCYVYPGDVIEVISNTPGNYHGKVHLFYYDDNDFGSSIQGNGLNNGGQIMYAAVDIEFPDEWVPGGSSLLAAFFATPTSGEAPLTVNFTDLSTGNPISWEWDFQNDGTIDSYEQNPSYTYTNAGLYTVSLTVSDGTNSDEEVKVEYIIVLPSTPHFIPVYQGNGYNNMTFFISGATIDGINMESGDEIGIFDGDICVGAGVLTSEIPPVFQMVASADDPTTGELDGFISGNPIVYRLWDSSDNTEITDVIPTYTLGDGTFIQLGTAMVDLEGSITAAPIADAGVDQTVNEGDLVQLDGSESYSPYGYDLTYLWTAPVGIELSDSTLVDPTFEAPEVSTNVPVEYEFILVVDDGISGNLRVISEPDTVVITVQNINQAPIADAGIDQTVMEFETAQLDGTGSSDPDGDDLTYCWISPLEITLNDSTIVNPEFIAPEVDENTLFDIILIVDDGIYNNLRISSEPDTVVIEVINFVGSDGNLLPTVTGLNQNIPNPFNPETTIEYSLKEPGNICLEIYNIRGQKVKTLVNEFRNVGYHSVIWNGKDESGELVSSGIYLYQLKVDGEYKASRKCILLK